MDATKGNIYEILNGNRQFLIPVYQRCYSWDIEQCERLWNDIVEMQKRKRDGHFVGSIVNIAEKAMPTGIQKYMIIDGAAAYDYPYAAVYSIERICNTKSGGYDD